MKGSGLQKIPGIDIERSIHHSVSESQAPRLTANDPAMNKGNILIIDDEPDILTVLKKTLQTGGYSTYGFVSPVAALEHFRKNPMNYHVVISDVRMPAMSGFQLAREIRNLNPKVKIILMTAFEINMSEFKKVLPSMAVDGFLNKPITSRHLNNIIEQAITQPDGSPAAIKLS